MKQKLRFWIGILFSLVSLALVLRTANLEETRSVLGQTNYYPLLPALFALGLTLVGKAARWRLLFGARHTPPLSKAFSVLVIGQMVNLLFPLRIGEVARAYYIGEMAGAPKPLAMATVVVEKVVDMLAVLALMALLLLSIPSPSWLQRPLLGLVLAAALLLSLLISLAHQRERLMGLLARLASLLPGAFRPAYLLEQVERSLDGLVGLRKARTMAPVGALTCLVWLSSAATNYFVLSALGVNLPLAASAFLLVVLQVGVAVPSGPGRIGVFQYLTILALSLFAVAPEKAFAIGVVLYLTVHIPPIILGLFFLWRYHLGLWRVEALTGEGSP